MLAKVMLMFRAFVDFFLVSVLQSGLLKTNKKDVKEHFNVTVSLSKNPFLALVSISFPG